MLLKNRFLFIILIISAAILSGCKPKVQKKDPTSSSGATGAISEKVPLTISSFYPNKGPTIGNTIITFRGTGLTRNMLITVGGWPCQFFEYYPTSVYQCTTPNGMPGPAQIIVNNTIIFSNGFTYEEKSPLTIKLEKNEMEINSSQTLSYSGGGGSVYFYLTEYNSGTITGNRYTAPSVPGIYKIQASDSIHSEAVTSVTVYGPIMITTDVAKGVATGHKLSFTAAGGDSPYSFSASNGTFNSNVYTAPNTKGSVTITATDSKNKKATKEIYVYEPPKIRPSDLKIVLGKTFSFATSGELFPLSIPSSLSIGEIKKINDQEFTITAKSEGSETIEITDAAGNTATATITVFLPLALEPDSITLNPNQELDFKISGGIPPYQFNSKLFANISTLTGRYKAPPTEGQDIVTVIDADIPPNVATSTVTIENNLKISSLKTNLNPNDTAILTVTGGVAPYTFSSDIGFINSISQIFTAPSTSGTANITVKDQLQNIATLQITILAPLLPLQIQPNTISVNTDATANFTVSGASGNYTSNSTKGTIVSPGVYKAPSSSGNDVITVTDSLGRTATANVTIQVAPPPISPDFQKWVFVKGDQGNNTSGNGSPAGRVLSSAWTGASPDLMLFGGVVNSGYQNDIWKFNSSDREWSLIRAGGSPSETNPGPRHGAATWTDASGNLWIFGGIGQIGETYQYFNDLWKFTTSSGTWTRIRNNEIPVVGTGSPSPRRYASTWTDSSGNLWLFGGGSSNDVSYDMLPFTDSGFIGEGIPDEWLPYYPIYGYFNDLWKYDIINKSWTQVQAIGTGPSARHLSNTWTDSNKNLWLFGGKSNLGFFNDLRKYNITDNKWTEVPQTNPPRARYGATNWRTPNGVLWLYGGMGTSEVFLDDLWKYESNQWTKVTGGISNNQMPVYGTPGFSNPGGRRGATGWIDQEGHLWLFGGNIYGIDENGMGLLKNDLWKFNLK